MKRQLIFSRQFPMNFWYSFNLLQRDEGLGPAWNHLALLNPAPWGSIPVLYIAQKWSFPLRIFLVNVSSGFGFSLWKTSFCVQCLASGKRKWRKSKQSNSNELIHNNNTLLQSDLPSRLNLESFIMIGLSKS